MHDVYRRTQLRPTLRVMLADGDAPATLSDAYATILSERPNGADWRGWKLGGTNHATRAAFDVTRGYFGAMDTSEILHQPSRAPGFALCEVKGEVEICLRLNADGTGYDAWAIGLEMPASAVENLPEAGVAALVADRCGAGALLLGPVTQGQLPDLSGQVLTLSVAGRDVSSAGLDALVDTPQAILADFLALAAEIGAAPQPGDWVATGGITACCDFAEGDRIRVTCGVQTVLDFEVRLS